MPALSKRPFGFEENVKTITRNLGKILLVTVLAVIVSGVGSFLLSKVYVASSRILIQTNREPLKVSAELVPGAGTANLTERDVVLTETEIFKSPHIANRLVEELGTDYVIEGMTWRWDWLKDLPGDLIGDAIDWAATVDLFVPLLELAGLTGDGKEIPDKWLAAQKIMENLEVAPVRKADVFQVAFIAPSAELSAEIVNELVDIYLEHHLAVRQSGVTQEFFETETQRLQVELSRAEKAFQEFKNEHGIVSLDVQKQTLLSLISEAEISFKNAELEARESEKSIAALRRQLSAQSRAVPISRVATRNPVISQLQAELTQLNLERNQYVEGSPAAVQLSEQIETIETQLAGEEKQISGAQTTGVSGIYLELQKALALEISNQERLETRDGLQQRESEYRDQLANLELRETEYRALQRSIDIKETALQQYLRKQEESRLSAVLDTNRITNAVRIEEASAPVRPVSPNKKQNIVLGLLMGIFGGVGVAYLGEYMRRTLISKREIEAQLNKPVLATLYPGKFSGTHSSAHNIKSSKKSNKKSKKDSETQFLQLYSELFKVLKPGQSTVFLVTSTLEGEGKTAVVNRCAQTIGNQGQSVLVIRVPKLNPKIENRFDKSESIDESHLADLSRTDHDNVYLSELQTNTTYLEAGKIADLYREKYDKVFDFILIDAPAFGTYPEAKCMARSADSIIYVVESDRADANEIHDVISSLENHNASVLGIVFRA